MASDRNCLDEIQVEELRRLLADADDAESADPWVTLAARRRAMRLHPSSGQPVELDWRAG